MQPKRLNIGCGRKKYHGYTTIDIEPKNTPDILGDFRTMNFSDIEEIRAEHLLEHFGRDEGVQVLKLWYDWLMPGGRLIVETPDFEMICAGFAEQNTYGRYWFTRHAYGSQEADWAFHRDGWYEDKFREILTEIGFEIDTVVRNKTRGILPNIKVLAIKK